MAKEEEKKSNISILRIAGTDIKTNDFVVFGLSHIKGVSYMFANALCEVLGIDKKRRIGSLKDEEIEKLEDYLSNSEMKEIPSWLKNQRKEYETGKDLHFTSKDLEFNNLKVRRRILKTKSYKAIRYKHHLPVRGQRTRSNFRRNKMLAAMKAKKEGRR